MEARGLEPLTLGLQSRCSSQLSYAPSFIKRAKEREVKISKPNFHPIKRDFVGRSYTYRITSYI